MIEITRYHDISMGHRVYGHESKCAHLHGHNYRFHFTVRPKQNLDNLGRVIDFGVIKDILCDWLEREWDHKMMLWREDPLADRFTNTYERDFANGIIIVPFNPTAENIAQYFVETIAPELFENDDVYLYSLTIDETAKCSAAYTIGEEKEAFLKRPKKFRQPENMPSALCCSKATNGEPCLCHGKSREQIFNCPHAVEDLPF